MKPIRIVDVGSINRDKFVVREGEGEFRGTVLIFPTAKLMNPKLWSEDEFSFRSIMVDVKTGRAVSCGWPKFFNKGERESDDKAWRSWMRGSEPIYWTEKIDGSLCIRYVWNGQVYFRTRGTFDCRYFQTGDEVYQLVKEKYPVLLDPEFCPKTSILFEHITPNNRIVIKYDNADLVFLGLIDNLTGYASDYSELQAFAQAHKLNLVQAYEIKGRRIGSAYAFLKQQIAVSSGVDGEGIVVRFGQKMLKLKREDYLELHRMRFALSGRKVAEFCMNQGLLTQWKDGNNLPNICCMSPEDWEITFADKFLDNFDFELLEFAWSSAKQVHAKVQSTVLPHLQAAIEIFSSIPADSKEEAKAFALYIQGHEKPEFHALLYSLRLGENWKRTVTKLLHDRIVRGNYRDASEG